MRLMNRSKRSVGAAQRGKVCIAPASHDRLVAAFRGRRSYPPGLAWRPRPTAHTLADIQQEYGRLLESPELFRRGAGFVESLSALELGDDHDVAERLRLLDPSLGDVVRVPAPASSTDAGLLVGVASLLLPLGVDTDATPEAYDLALYLLEALGERCDDVATTRSRRPLRIFGASEIMSAASLTRRHVFLVDDGHGEIVWLAGDVIAR
jgi:hypothetical protein